MMRGVMPEQSTIYSSEKMTVLVRRCFSSENGVEMLVERQRKEPRMEQLASDITNHVLSYLDYSSLCCLSMTNSVMRKAASDDITWKALYHKDFTLEQDNVIPANGWKAYYAATRAIVDINNEFIKIVKKRSVPAMGQLWFNADYVTCFHGTGDSAIGYNAVMKSWQSDFGTTTIIPYFLIRDARIRVLENVAWVTMKTYIDMETLPSNVTNVYELHNGRWQMVHHHSTAVVILVGVEPEQQPMQG